MKRIIIQIYIINYIISLKLYNLNYFSNFKLPVLFNYNIKLNISTFESKFINTNISFGSNIQKQHIPFDFVLEKTNSLEPTYSIFNTIMQGIMHYNFILLPLFILICTTTINSIPLFNFSDLFKCANNYYNKLINTKLILHIVNNVYKHSDIKEIDYDLNKCKINNLSNFDKLLMYSRPTSTNYIVNPTLVNFNSNQTNVPYFPELNNAENIGNNLIRLGNEIITIYPFSNIQTGYPRLGFFRHGYWIEVLPTFNSVTFGNIISPDMVNMIQRFNDLIYNDQVIRLDLDVLEERTRDMLTTTLDRGLRIELDGGSLYLSIPQDSTQTYQNIFWIQLELEIIE